MIFTGTNSLGEAREKLKQAAKHFIITLGSNGALVYDVTRSLLSNHTRTCCRYEWSR